MKIPFHRPDIGASEIAGVVECLESGWLTSGSKVLEFEAAFASAVGARHAIACSSATMAALLLLEAIDVKGQEVIVPTYTFSGPAMMAHKLGAKIVLADCLPGSYQIDPADVAKLITPNTVAVMPTHFGGSACDMTALYDLCKWEGLELIDDAAHAFPTLDGRSGNMVGSGRESLATFFSFYATKTLTTGEGGMITTNANLLATTLRSLRSHGFNRPIHDRYTNIETGWRYEIAEKGWKANMNDIAAAIGLGQLKRAGDLHAARANVARSYFEGLSGLPGIGLPAFDHQSAWHLFPLQVDRRDAFIEHMAAREVQCSVHFIPLHQHSAWSRILERDRATRLRPKQYSNADAMFSREVSLPLWPGMTRPEVAHVVASVKEWTP